MGHQKFYLIRTVLDEASVDFLVVWYIDVIVRWLIVPIRGYVQVNAAVARLWDHIFIFLQ